MCHTLIIEDDWLIAEFLTALVEEAGATSVTTVATEDEAVAAAREQVPGIILSDVMLAAGTGPLAVETILAESGRIPIMFITATPEACQTCSGSPVILTKPVLPRLVIETFRRLAPLELPPLRPGPQN